MEIPARLRDAFTQCGAILVSNMYIDETMGGQGLHLKFPRAEVNAQLQHATRLLAMADKTATDLKSPSRFATSMKGAVRYALDAMRRHRDEISGGAVAVFGSQRPTYEAMALALGAASVSVFEYQPPVYESEQISSWDCRDVAAAAAEEQGWTVSEGNASLGARHLHAYDVALSISSFDHDGLGRYGDPLSPDADLRAMDVARAILVPWGVLLVSVPVGPDEIAFNMMRRYGTLRLPRLLEGWAPVSTTGWVPQWFSLSRPIRHSYEPVFAVTPDPSGQWTASKWRDTLAPSKAEEEQPPEREHGDEL
jgi:hypothetical protein